MKTIMKMMLLALVAIVMVAGAYGGAICLED